MEHFTKVEEDMPELRKGEVHHSPIVIMIDITTKIMITTTVIHIITTKITTTGCVQSTFRLS